MILTDVRWHVGLVKDAIWKRFAPDHT